MTPGKTNFARLASLMLQENNLDFCHADVYLLLESIDEESFMDSYFADMRELVWSR